MISMVCSQLSIGTMANIYSPCSYGLYFLAAMDIFQQLRGHPELRVGVSLFEIYGGKLHDLFNNRQPVKGLEDAHGQIHFRGLSERKLKSPHDLMRWIHEGSSLRSTGISASSEGSAGAATSLVGTNSRMLEKAQRL